MSKKSRQSVSSGKNPCSAYQVFNEALMLLLKVWKN